MFVKVNLNDTVRFKRTPEVDSFMQKIYEDYWTKFNPAYLESNPKPYPLTYDSEYHELNLWSFMADFGSYMYNGNIYLPSELVNIELDIASINT